MILMLVQYIHMSHIFIREQGLCLPCLARRRDWEQDIRSQLTRGTEACWVNSDASMWDSEPWEIAKVFMGEGHKSFRAGGGDTIALLQLVTNCRLFASLIANRQSFVDVSSHILMLQ